MPRKTPKNSPTWSQQLGWPNMAYGTILHVNAVGLAAAIEENLERSLRGFPFVIASASAPRAVVIDVSRSAHTEGIRRGMSLTRARDLIPGIVVRGPRPDLYHLADESSHGSVATIPLSSSPQAAAMSSLILRGPRASMVQRRTRQGRSENVFGRK
jgi:hypothetical protein